MIGAMISALPAWCLPFFLRLLFVYDMSGNGTPVYDGAGAILYYTDASGVSADFSVLSSVF